MGKTRMLLSQNLISKTQGYLKEMTTGGKVSTSFGLPHKLSGSGNRNFQSPHLHQMTYSDLSRPAAILVEGEFMGSIYALII